MQSPALFRAQRTAQRLLALEVGSESDALVAVCDRLRNHFGALVGRQGFRMLLQRSLVISRKSSLDLKKFVITDSGAVDGIEEIASQLTPVRIKAASTALIGQVLVLLETFIGEALTQQLLEEIWPGAPYVPANLESRKL